MNVQPEEALRRTFRVADDFTVRQIGILLALYDQPKTVRRIASELQVVKAVVTRGLDSMGTRGLVTRQRDEEDKRSVTAKLTPSGRWYVRKVINAKKSGAYSHAE